MKLLSRFREQRVILEEVESGLNRIVEVLRVADLGIVLRTGFVVANACQVSHGLAGADRPGLLRKCRTVLLHRRVEIELSPLPQLHGGRWP